MISQRRVRKLVPELESMDSRVVPSVVGAGHGFRARAALALHRAAAHRVMIRPMPVMPVTMPSTRVSSMNPVVLSSLGTAAMTPAATTTNIGDVKNGPWPRPGGT